MKIGKRNILLQIIVMIVLLILVIGITYTCFKSKNKKLNIQNISNGALSIMLENEHGEYEKNERTTWPTEEEGYYFSYSLSYCENGSTLSWEDNKVRLKTAGSDKCYAYFSHTKEEPPIDPGEPSEPSNPIDPNVDKSEVLKKLLADAKEGTLLYHGAILLNGIKYGLLNGAGDDSYRYSGKSDDVYNYVCLDNQVVTGAPIACANDDLYRIIGLFKNDNSESDDYEQYEMKLIKSDYATETQLGTGGARSSSNYSTTSDKQYYKGELTTIPRYYWTSSSNSVNKWDGSALNTTNLKTNFIAYLKTEGRKENLVDHIEEYKWKVAGNTWSNIGEQTVVTAYQNEIVKATGGNGVSANTTYPAQIGLMYVSDYGYAAYQDAWTSKTLNSYNDTTTRDNNWMYMGLDEWTITRRADYTNYAFNVENDSYVGSGNVYSHNNYSYVAVRPSFYLKSSTKIASGHGKKDDPYRISW